MLYVGNSHLRGYGTNYFSTPNFTPNVCLYGLRYGIYIIEVTFGRVESFGIEFTGHHIYFTVYR